MAPLRPVLSRRAEEDLARQYRWYFENANEHVAERYLIGFDAAVLQLSAFPESGRARRFRAPALTGIRSVAVAKPFEMHLIFYRVEVEQLSIERVLYGARDLPQQLNEPNR